MVSAGPAPSRIGVRMYRVGFGDSFLLTFEYRTPPGGAGDTRSERHILIDCGSTKHDPDGPSMADVVAEIEADCGGALDVLVVTHRHSDHLSAWDAAASAATMDRLHPRLVVRPWTDDPAAPIDATGPVALDDGSRRFAASLRAGQDAAHLLGCALGAGDGRSLQGELGKLARDQVPSQAAVNRLEGYAKNADAAYVAYGGDTRITHYVPGVEVDVLGPPTVAQWPGLTNQRSSDPDEFWMLSRSLVEEGFSEAGVDPTDPHRWDVLLVAGGIGPARWLLERLDHQRTASLLRIVRTFDASLNNTSLILLFKVGRRLLLFSGDAQIENWSYVLTGAPDAHARRDELGRIDL